MLGRFDILANTSLAVIYIDLNQQFSMVANHNGVSGLKNIFLGTLLYSGTGANNYLYADTSTNPPFLY